MEINVPQKGSCHCSSVQFEVELPNGFEELSRCNCSMCARRGAIVSSIPKESFKIIQGGSNLSLYQFNTKTAEHYFCSTCGIYTHHKRRSNPSQYAVNIACIEGVKPFELGEVQLLNGRNHPCDMNK